MKTATRSLTCLFVLAGAAAAQPTVNAGGIVNAASYAQAGLPGSGIAQGSMFIVFGTNLGTTSDISQLKFPLQTQIGGTSIRITSGSATRDALMIYTTPTQVAAILPSDTPTGTASLTVTVNGQTSAPQSFAIVQAAFGIFTRNQAGSGPAIVQNFLSTTNQPINGLTTVTGPNQAVTLWGTGLGAATGNEAAGPVPGATKLPVQVFVGDKPAALYYAGRSGCCAALDQVIFTVPDGVQGCYVPVYVRVNGVSSNFGSISIATSGSACTDQPGLTVSDLQKLAQGARTSLVVLSRLGLSISAGGLSVDTSTDTGTGVFNTFSGVQFLATQGIGLPAAGSCAVYSFTGSNILPTDPVKGSPLDAGAALNVSGPNGARQIPKTASGSYAATLSGGGVGTAPASYLSPGSYTVDNGAGGADVGAFSAKLTVPAPLTWTNRAAVTAQAIPRTQPLSLTWTGGDPAGLVEIAGAAAAGSGSGGATFVCTAPTSAGQFTVPANILGGLPASGSAGIAGAGGFLLIGTSGQPTKFTATGIDVGRALSLTLIGNGVSYQ